MRCPSRYRRPGIDLRCTLDATHPGDHRNGDVTWGRTTAAGGGPKPGAGRPRVYDRVRLTPDQRAVLDAVGRRTGQDREEVLRTGGLALVTCRECAEYGSGLTRIADGGQPCPMRRMSPAVDHWIAGRALPCPDATKCPGFRAKEK